MLLTPKKILPGEVNLLSPLEVELENSGNIKLILEKYIFVILIKP